MCVRALLPNSRVVCCVQLRRAAEVSDERPAADVIDGKLAAASRSIAVRDRAQIASLPGAPAVVRRNASGKLWVLRIRA